MANQSQNFFLFKPTEDYFTDTVQCHFDWSLNEKWVAVVSPEIGLNVFETDTGLLVAHIAKGQYEPLAPMLDKPEFHRVLWINDECLVVLLTSIPGQNVFYGDLRFLKFPSLKIIKDVDCGSNYSGLFTIHAQKNDRSIFYVSTDSREPNKFLIDAKAFTCVLVQIIPNFSLKPKATIELHQMVEHDPSTYEGDWVVTYKDSTGTYETELKNAIIHGSTDDQFLFYSKNRHFYVDTFNLKSGSFTHAWEAPYEQLGLLASITNTFCLFPSPSKRYALITDGACSSAYHLPLVAVK